MTRESLRVFLLAWHTVSLCCQMINPQLKMYFSNNFQSNNMHVQCPKLPAFPFLCFHLGNLDVTLHTACSIITSCKVVCTSNFRLLYSFWILLSIMPFFFFPLANRQLLTQEFCMLSSLNCMKIVLVSERTQNLIFSS